jgi:hypothetical protein
MSDEFYYDELQKCWLPLLIKVDMSKEKLNVNIIEKFIFNTIKRNTMKSDKPTRLRFAKLPEADVWRTKPVMSAQGFLYVEIVKTQDTGMYSYKIATYPSDTIIESEPGVADFHKLKVSIKTKLKGLGCAFLDEVRKKDTVLYGTTNNGTGE